MSFNLYVEQEMVVQNVKKELYRWNSSYVPERLPSHPVELSYWVIQNLPLDDDLRLNLMGIDSAVQRLRCSLSIVQKVQTLCKVLYYCIQIYFCPVIFPPSAQKVQHLNSPRHCYVIDVLLLRTQWLPMFSK